MEQALKGKVALVTGANRGIGKAVALALGAEGAIVAVQYATHMDEAAAVAAEIEARGGESLVVGADVSRAGEVAAMLAAVRREAGPVSVLVNNAGVTRPQAIEAITEKDWDEVLAVNLKSVFLVTQAALPDMRAARWGRIVNMSSVAAQLGGVVGPHYAASKAGIIGLTHSYASLLAREGITVNAVAPALIDTAMIRDIPKVRPDLLPVGRFGTVEEVAEATLMLVKNGYVTGQTINVNGGWYMS